MQKMVTGETGIGPGGQGSGSAGSGSGSDTFHTGTVSHGGGNGLWKAMAWGGLVGAAVGGGVWIYGFAKANGAQGYDQTKLDKTGTSTAGMNAFYDQNMCGTSDGNIVAGLPGASNQKFADGCSGNKISKIGVGLTIGFGVVGVVGFVMAYARGDHDEKPVSVTSTVGHRAKKRPPFAIVPVVGAQGGGATFAMEW
jgi:hypothetical protein